MANMCLEQPDFQAPLENREENELSLPPSPHSLSQNDLFRNYHAGACVTDVSGIAHPSTLHLQPVTWESLKKIDFPPGEHFEVVDGILIWIPMAHGTTLHQQVMTYLVLIVVQLRSWFATSNVDLEVASLNGSHRKLLKSGDPDVNRRGPDVVILRDHSAASETSSESGHSTTLKKEKFVYRTKERPPYAVIEVTSESTRLNDLTSKWIQYALTGIKFYYIVDLNGYESSGEACVVVGSMGTFENAVRCYHGSPNGLPSSCHPPPNIPGSKFYYKKVYRGQELVKAGVFEDLQLNAKQFMDPAYMKLVFRSLKHGDATPNRNNVHSDVITSVCSIAGHFCSAAGHVCSSGSPKRQDDHAKQTKQSASSATSRIRSSAGTPSTSPPRSPDKKRSRHK